MLKLYIPIGILGSGKSTWAKKMAIENPNVKIVCPDAIRTMLNGGYKYIRELDEVIDVICYNILFDLLLRKFDVIVDCCNLTQGRRKYWLQIVTKYANVEKIAVIFPNKDENWHVDNSMKSSKNIESKEYWESIYDLHIGQFKPIDEKDFGEIIYVKEF